jgi:two-component system, OmpR family, response regulator CssR
MSYLIYLVEDDENLNKILTSYLENEDWRVRSFLRGRAAQEAIAEHPHLWILDIMLPDIDGYQLINDIKKVTIEVPVIFISARDADLDRITGLEKGSDDYLAKPFSPRELVIRVHRILERVYGSKKNTAIISYSDYRIELDKRAVFNAKGRIIELTSLEFNLLIYLLNNRQQALTREQILNAIWGEDYYGRDRVVDDTIRRLRKKLPLLRLETLYGFGYKLVDADASFER